MLTPKRPSERPASNRPGARSGIEWDDDYLEAGRMSAATASV